MRNEKRKYNKILAYVLTLVLAVGIAFVPAPLKINAAKVLTLKAAYNYAITNSEKIEKIEYDILTKQAALKSAVKSLALKAKDRSTFRWSPLLSFKFPRDPTMMETYEERFKPAQIQSELDKLNHSLGDEKLTIRENINNLFLEIVTCKTKIDFEQSRVESMQVTLEKNRARMNMGDADPKDIATMEAKISALQKQISENTINMENAKNKLSDATGVDVRYGYDFENPFVEAAIPYSALGFLQETTLERSQSYYDVCQAYTVARLSFDNFRSLISGEYGSKYNRIAGYVNSVASGQKVNSVAFKKAYDQFITDIDEPWAGDYKIRIIFFTIRFPKERLKGDLDGSRYIEDEPYALFEASNELQSARIEKSNTEKELRKQVEDQYNSYINMRNAYDSLRTTVEDTKKSLGKDEILNRLGEITYDEFKSSQDSYDDLEQELVQSLSDYSNTLFSLDRLTCGAVTDFLSGKSENLVSIGGGTSTVQKETAEGASYYIEQQVQDEAFKLSVYIPDDFDITITDFQLYCDNRAIGDKTPIGDVLKHLNITTKSITEAKIRLYNGDQIVCDCGIDPTEISGPLEIVKDFIVEDVSLTDICSYTYTEQPDSHMMTLSIDKDIKDTYPEALYYQIYDENDKMLGTEGTYTDIESIFQYPIALLSSLDKVTIKFYSDNQGTYLLSGYFTGDKVKKLDE